MTRNTVRRSLTLAAALLTVLGGTVLSPVPTAAPAPAQPFHVSDTEAPATSCAYDAVVLADSPTAFWPMENPAAGVEADLSGSGLDGRYVASPVATTLPNGDLATKFDGTSQYMEVDDAAELSPATTGELTVEAWMRPDTLDFADDESSGYVHWMGKGLPGAHEYVARMYSIDNTSDRANRISGYLFNAVGGLGAGSYFQDPLTAGEWIHYVLVINSDASSEQFPNGYTKIYRDGVLRDQDDLSIRGTVITPERGDAPFRVGTRDFASFFEGAVGKVAVYDVELPARRIAAHHTVMTALSHGHPGGRGSGEPAVRPSC